MQVFFVRFNKSKELLIVDKGNKEKLLEQWNSSEQNLEFNRLDAKSLTKKILVLIRRTSVNNIEIFEAEESTELTENPTQLWN